MIQSTEPVLQRPRLQRVDVSALAREVPVPGPAVLHLRVDEWLEVLRDEAACVIGNARFDPLDALRSQLLTRGSAALASAAVAEVLGARHAGELVLLRNESVDAPIAGLVGRASRHPLATLPSLLPWALDVRAAAYIVRREFRSFWAQSSAATSNGAARPVLLLPRELVHLSDLLPLADELAQKHGIFCLFLCSSPKIEARLRAAGHAPLRAEEWCAAPPVAALAVTRAAVQAARRAAKLARNGHPRFTTLELTALARVARRVLLQSAGDLRRTATATLRLVKALRPRLLVVGNPYTLEGRVAAYVARAHAVPSAAIQHGAIFPDDPRWRRCPVDRLCVWGEASRRAMLSCGSAAEALEVTGSPRLDAVLSGWRSVAFDPGQPASVLVATSGPGDLVSHAQHREFIAMLYDAAARVPELALVVKLHPKDREEHYRDHALRWPAARVELVRGDASRHGLDIFDFLKTARALVTVSSTTALDAMLAGVPVVAATVTGRPVSLQSLPFLNPPLAHGVASADELAAAFQRVLHGTKLGDTIRASAYAGDYFKDPGRSVQGTARALLELGKREGE